MSGWGFAGSLVGAATDIGMGLFNAHHSAKEARAADKRAYGYWRQMQLHGPKLMRQGYEDAGYNPMLALNGGSASMPSTHQGTSNVPSVSAGAAQMGKLFEDLVKDKAQAEVDNIEADTELKDAQKNEAKTRTLQSAATTELTNSQTERNDLAYGRDIVDSVVDVAGTGAQIYSAKSITDMAKSNANKQNAKAKAKRPAPNNAGKPAVQGSVNSQPSAGGAAGSSAKGAGKFVKELMKYLAPAAVLYGGYEGSQKMQEKSEKLNRETNRDSEGRERVRFRGYGRLHSFR